MKQSLFSVGYAGLWGQEMLNVSAFIGKASQLGYESVMLMGKRPHLSPLDATPDRIVAIKRVLEEHTISCDVVGGYTDFSPTTAAEIPYYEMQLAYVESLARIASELGASVVRLFTAYEAPGQSPLAVWQIVVSCLREASVRAEEFGVTLAVQNHHDTAVDTSALAELLAEIDQPNCKAGFDAWSPALRGEDLYQTARRMAPFMAITTNADYQRFPRYHYRPDLVNYESAEPDLVRAVPFGEGFIDYEQFFRGLRDGGFDGIASYEMCSPIRGGGSMQNLDTCAAAYLDWFRDNMPGAS